MAVQCIDAEYKSEERYTKISLSYGNDEQLEQINKAIESVDKNSNLESNIYTTDLANGRKVVVLEYHDDYDREAGTILEQLMDILHIDKCRG